MHRCRLAKKLQNLFNIQFVNTGFIWLTRILVGGDSSFLFQAFPFFGVQPALLDESGKEIDAEGEGYLVFKRPWPAIMRTLYNNHKRYESTYFSKFPGYYCTGDGNY